MTSTDRAVAGLRAGALRPVSSASTALLRIAFGVAMVINVALYVPVLVHQYYLEPEFTFGYPPLEFVSALPGAGMYLVYAATALAAVAIALGWHYRISVAVFLMLHTYVFLIDTTNFQNHEYLIVLVSIIFWIIPAHCRWSLDARRKPELASAVVPAWMVWFLRFQIAIPYFFGGIAKLNSDWLAGEPLRMWLADRTDIGPINTLLTNDSVVWSMTYGSLVLDLVIVPLLLWRRSRIPAFVVVTCFHLMNAWLFGLFIFPWLMIAATTIFFEPDWPERALHRLRKRKSSHSPSPARNGPAQPGRMKPALGPAMVSFLALWVAVQLLLPLRHYIYPSNPSWTEEGHRFAWHMMLRSKQGTVTFEVTDAAGITHTVSPGAHLNDKQAARLAGHPERLVLFARYLSDQHGGAEVRAGTSVSFNGRDHQRMVDPDVDLSQKPTVWAPGADWIEPQTEPLPER